MKRIKSTAWVGAFAGAVLTTAVAHAAPPAKATPGPKKLTSADMKVQVGDRLPEFRIRTGDGTLINSAELAYPGKDLRWSGKRPVLIDFFRTDCEPCIEALPELVKLHEKYSGAGLTILLVALLEPKDDQQTKLNRFLGSKRLPFTVVIDSTEHVAKKLMGRFVSLPATFLVDRTGIVRKTKFDARGTLARHLGPTLKAVLAAHRKAGQP